MVIWQKGDLLCMCNELLPLGQSVYFGRYVFEAEHEPRIDHGIIRYGDRNAKEIRLATLDDIEHLKKAHIETIIRESSSLDKLMQLQKKHFPERMDK